jgi:hypothetical protein
MWAPVAPHKAGDTWYTDAKEDRYGSNSSKRTSLTVDPAKSIGGFSAKTTAFEKGTISTSKRPT